MSTAPTVTARALRGRECWTLVVTCPYCGKEHRHGGGAGDIPDGGHRTPHCMLVTLRKDRQGYILDPEIVGF